LANNIASNEIQNYLNIPNSPFTASYWVSKGLMATKATSVLVPLMVLL
jgi:hypothetical protein